MSWASLDFGHNISRSLYQWPKKLLVLSGPQNKGRLWQLVLLLFSLLCHFHDDPAYPMAPEGQQHMGMIFGVFGRTLQAHHSTGL